MNSNASLAKIEEVGGECGEMFRCIHWNNRGCKSIVWRCVSRLDSTGLECHARTVNEKELEQVVLKALNELLAHKESYQQQLQANIAYVIRLCARGEVQAINEQLIKLQQELLDKVSKRQNYDEIAGEIFQFREKKASRLSTLFLFHCKDAFFTIIGKDMSPDITFS